VRRELRALAATVAGFFLLIVGVLLLVLPGPGLLLVLAGLLLLSDRFAWARRITGPVRDRAVVAARAGVESGWRLAGSTATGLVLITAGVVLGIDDELPGSGWAVGAGLVVSGVALLGVLIWSWRTYRVPERPAPGR